MSLNFTDIVTMLMKNEDLQSVLDAMAEHLLATVIVTNDVMDIIACSKTVAPRDPYWVQALSDGYCSSEMLAAIYKTPPANVPRVSEIYSGLDYAPDNATLKYFVSLPKDTFHYSFSVFALPLENRVEKRQQDLLLSFAGLLKSTHFRTEKLPLANVYQGKKGYLQTLLNPESEYLLQTEIPASVANSSADFDHIQVLVFSPELQETVDMLLFAHTEAICSLTGNDYATVYNGSVVALFHTKKMDEYFEEQFVQLAKEANAKIGISWAFSGKEHVKRHYKQAVFSLETARALRLPGHIFTYDDTYIYALIRGCTKQDYWAANEHPVLTCLRDYDTAHDSSLYDTLYCLLKCGMNSSLAATKMGIHKSTLFHRIEVLNELIPGIMTKNTDWQASVMLSFDLTQLKNKQ